MSTENIKDSIVGDKILDITQTTPPSDTHGPSYIYSGDVPFEFKNDDGDIIVVDPVTHICTRKFPKPAKWLAVCMHNCNPDNCGNYPCEDSGISEVNGFETKKEADNFIHMAWWKKYWTWETVQVPDCMLRESKM